MTLQITLKCIYYIQLMQTNNIQLRYIALMKHPFYVILILTISRIKEFKAKGEFQDSDKRSLHQKAVQTTEKNLEQHIKQLFRKQYLSDMGKNGTLS